MMTRFYTLLLLLASLSCITLGASREAVALNASDTQCNSITLSDAHDTEIDPALPFNANPPAPYSPNHGLQAQVLAPSLSAVRSRYSIRAPPLH